jgi:hypothetical protein
MSSKTDVYLGAPIEIDSERAFLYRLQADFEAAGKSGLILANFLLSPRQIDFLIIVDQVVCHVELKNLTAPICGGVNGEWRLQLPDGTVRALDRENPYRQALDGKYALSDEMHAYLRRHPTVNSNHGQKFYKYIESVVCIYPDLAAGSILPSDRKVHVLG